jgi:hypothetical protein
MHPRGRRCSFLKYRLDILGRRALPTGRLAGLGARRSFHHELLATPQPYVAVPTYARTSTYSGLISRTSRNPVLFKPVSGVAWLRAPGR